MKMEGTTRSDVSLSQIFRDEKLCVSLKPDFKLPQLNQLMIPSTQVLPNTKANTHTHSLKLTHTHAWSEWQIMTNLLDLYIAKVSHPILTVLSENYHIPH